MKKALSIFITFLALFLLIPMGLILASWNALPGDSIYPIKTGLEKVALKLAGETLLERRLEVKYTERRFTEAEKLLIQQHSTRGFAQLLSQVQIAKEKTVKAQDVKTKQKLVANLTEFNQKLEERKEEMASAPTTSPPQETTSPPQEPEEIIEDIEETQEEIEEVIEELEEEIPTPPGHQMQEAEETEATEGAQEEAPTEGEIPEEPGKRQLPETSPSESHPSTEAGSLP